MIVLISQQCLHLFLSNTNACIDHMDNQVGAACLIKHTDMNAPTLRRPQRILNEADEDLEEAALITEEPRQGRVR